MNNKRLYLSTSSHYVDFGFQKKKKSRMWGVRKASSHQRNTGMLPKCPSHSRSLLWVRSRIWGMRQSRDEPPNCHCAHLPLFPCSFLSEPNEGTPVLWRCPPPSQLSFHWLHMKNNETSFETRLQKNKGGGWGVCSKSWRRLSSLCGRYLWGGL